MYAADVAPGETVVVVGLGGIGEAQRFVSTAAFHYPDNLFLFLLQFMGNRRQN